MAGRDVGSCGRRQARGAHGRPLFFVLPYYRRERTRATAVTYEKQTIAFPRWIKDRKILFGMELGLIGVLLIGIVTAEKLSGARALKIEYKRASGPCPRRE